MTTFTPEKKEKFLNALRKWPNVARAARLCGVSRQTVYNHRWNDEAFAAAWDEALVEGVDRLEEEAERRGFKGVLEPVYYKGEKVGSVRRYSDTLAIFLLKAYRPEKYRENIDITSGGKVLAFRADDLAQAEDELEEWTRDRDAGAGDGS